MRKTKEQISYNMQQVKNKDSEIELVLENNLNKSHSYRGTKGQLK